MDLCLVTTLTDTEYNASNIIYTLASENLIIRATMYQVESYIIEDTRCKRKYEYRIELISNYDKYEKLIAKLKELH